MAAEDEIGFQEGNTVILNIDVKVLSGVSNKTIGDTVRDIVYFRIRGTDV